MSKKYANILHAVYEAEFSDGSTVRMSFGQDRKRYDRGTVDFDAGRALADRIRNPLEVWAPFVFHRYEAAEWSAEICERVARYYATKGRFAASERWSRKATRAELVAGRVHIRNNGEIVATHPDPMGAAPAAKVTRLTPKKALQQLVRALEGEGDVSAALALARQVAA